jgi:SAM-dependent methyltransferase
LWQLPEPFESEGFAPDTFVMWNVLEHVGDDVRALAEMERALAPGGRVVIFSPAGRSMMSAMDSRMGHFRRYGRRELSRKARAAGLVPVVERQVNLVGALGWWVNARFLARRELPRGQSRLFDLLVPLLRLWEDRLPVPWGLSVLFVAEKPAR